MSGYATVMTEVAKFVNDDAGRLEIRLIRQYWFVSSDAGRVG